MVFFWACEVTETKAAAVEVPEGFVLNVCNATASSLAVGDVSLGVETLQMDKQPWKGVVAHLGKTAGAFQVKLDLVFSQKAKFYLAKGSGKVHVTGYFQPGPPSDMFEEDIPLIVGDVKPAAESHKSKKRAREENAVTWDQSPSDSESEEKSKPAKTEKAPAPASTKKQEKKEEKKHEKKEEKKSQPQASPAANGTPSQPGQGKKKRKKNKKAHANNASQ